MTTSLPPDPYQILGVARDATLSEIRSAHRKLVLKCHPDKVDPDQKQEKQEEFQRVQCAYEKLSDPTERAKYDDLVKVHEIRAQAQAQAAASASASSTSANTSAARSPPSSSSAQFYRSSEARATSFTTSGGSAKMYTQGPKSWEHIPKEPAAKSTRRTASFNEPSAAAKKEMDEERRRRDDYTDEEEERMQERERERDRDRDRERERDRDRPRDHADRDREQRDDRERERDMDRERRQYEKTRRSQKDKDDVLRAEEKRARKEEKERKRDEERKANNSSRSYNHGEEEDAAAAAAAAAAASSSTPAAAATPSIKKKSSSSKKDKSEKRDKKDKDKDRTRGRERERERERDRDRERERQRDRDRDLVVDGEEDDTVDPDLEPNRRRDRSVSSQPPESFEDQAKMDIAMQYMAAARAKAPAIQRANTFSGVNYVVPPVPMPPMDEDEAGRRPSIRTRRGSTESRTKEKLSTSKRSGSSLKETFPEEDPYMVGASPPSRHVNLPRASTSIDRDHMTRGSVEIPIPARRADTYQWDDREAHGRNRSKHHSQVAAGSDDDSDDDLLREPRVASRRSSRALSPGPAAAATAASHSYEIPVVYSVREGRNSRHEETPMYRMSPDRTFKMPSYSYVTPPMSRAQFSVPQSKVRTAPHYTDKDINFAGSYRDPAYGVQQA